ncbi:MAG TPA: hypothetical protein DDX29_02390 [Clostridiales bacterium]|nr:hypothetical protein [Clostridiales bacterium]
MLFVIFINNKKTVKYPQLIIVYQKNFIFTNLGLVLQKRDSHQSIKMNHKVINVFEKKRNSTLLPRMEISIGKPKERLLVGWGSTSF